jgi:hypothetical protein
MTAFNASVFFGVCLSVAAAATVVTLEGPHVLARVVVGDDAVRNSTYISELYVKRAGSIATANVSSRRRCWRLT